MSKTITYIAKVTHAANRAYAKALGDHSIASWADSPQEMKDSVINGVWAVIDNPEGTPEASHKNWLAFKLSTGWTYGTNKDFDKKTHPCMVDYDKLPLHQKAKDCIFRAVVLEMSGNS